MLIDNKWFEMSDLKQRSLLKSSWIPLCAYDYLREKGNYGYVGYEKEYFGATAIIFSVNDSEKALSLDWMDILRHSHRPYVENNIYLPSEIFQCHAKKLEGIYPILQQSVGGGESKRYHLLPDVFLGLGLILEGDKWVCPEEDYLEVARIKRGSDGDVSRFEIRTEHLRDFLCAKNSGLLVATYQCREIIVDSTPDFKWKNDRLEETGENFRWSGYIQTIVEGGMPYGSKSAYFHMGRKNVDFKEDVPSYGSPLEDEFESTSLEKTHKGKQLFRIGGEMWRNEWIPPASNSPRIRGDRIEPKVSFIVDTSGKKMAGQELQAYKGWLWFKPNIVNVLLEKRKATFIWHTENTASIGHAPGWTVPFGVNTIGLINVLAKDISLLPEIYQNIWVAYNISPDGGVSEELLSAQMKAIPASTKAPEELLRRAINHLQTVSNHFLGRTLFKDHPDTEKILNRIHRFHGRNIEGICFIAKELTRLIIERIDVDLLKEINPEANSDFKSMRRLEYFITSKGFDGRKVMAPLSGIYELRKGDAHLPSETIMEALQLLDIVKTENYLEVAKQMIKKAAICIGVIGDIIIKTYNKQSGTNS